MGIVSKYKTFVGGQVLTDADLNALDDRVRNEFNGNIEDANVKSGAAIAKSKISSSGTWTEAEMPSQLSPSGGIDAGDTGIYLKTKVINIGDWNMVSQNPLNVSHGLTLSNVRTIKVLIRNDGDTIYYPIDFGNPNPQGSSYIDATNVVLQRVSGGIFDSTVFDATSYNRGFILIEYI